MESGMPRTSNRRLNVHNLLHALAAGLSLLVSACTNLGDVRQPIPNRLIVAPGSATHRTLVVMLPGKDDNVKVMDRAGVAQAIQHAWPDADVLLTSATMAYYTQGRIWQRLHDEVVEPMRARGYTDIWMAGASLGGMGALLYEQHYPGELNGIVVLAPYLGEPPLAQDITAAGGLAHWQPGPVPSEIDAGNFRHELWRWLQTWIGHADPAGRVWMGYGDHDKLRYAFPNFTPLLPQDHVIVRPGWHAWTTWTPLITEILGRIRIERANTAR
jgi:pimeloyl-ACP methyl ester carboxylesterase